MHAISPEALTKALSDAQPPLVLDVRRAAARTKSGRQITGAVWRDPALWLDWKDEIAQRAPVVLYCAHGQEISQALTTALQVLGARAVFLDGGFAAWEAGGGTCEPLQPTA
ncbi:rhodanese-like domain-containing protein [Hydrogenophaga sp. RWCD_12]|uniref:rhodanese-like domain-containing protein n=1 Tax=Hydrogenophaga sp. RWCD_12 TaxID=3391190 RepID=UPI0039852F11